ncbi:MAG: nucleoside-diphosphate kinase [Planctomycetota bacterium]
MVLQLVGATKVTEAAPGTIAVISLSTQQNLIHASDSPASAEREQDLAAGRARQLQAL